MVFTGFGGNRSSSGGGSVIDNRTQSGQARPLINKIQASGWNSLSANEKANAQKWLSADEFSKYALGKSPSGGGIGGTGGTGGGGSLDANSLMELYQKGLGAGASTDDQIRLLREGNTLDLQRKRAEQDMQMEGQRQALSQAQEARAKERETEATLQRRQQSTERSNAMAAYKGL